MPQNVLSEGPVIIRPNTFIIMVKKAHTIKYEIAICPYRKKIIWVFGGVPSGIFHDLKLAEIGFYEILDDGEKVLGDKAYIGNDHSVTPIKGPVTEAEKMVNQNIGAIRVDVERMIGRFKIFNCLCHKWRHNRDSHPLVFGVIAEIVNIETDLSPI